MATKMAFDTHQMRQRIVIAARILQSYAFLMLTSFSVHSITTWSADGIATPVLSNANVLAGKLCALLWPLVWFCLCAMNGIDPSTTVHLKYRYGSKMYTLASEACRISEGFRSLKRYRRADYNPKNMFVILNAQIDGTHQVNNMLESYVGPFGLLPQTKAPLYQIFPHIGADAKCSVMGIKGGVLNTSSFGYCDIVDL